MMEVSQPNRSRPINTPDGEIAPPALTDIFDEQRGILLVRYPIWLIVALGISGIIAFAITGYLGYGNPPTPGHPATLEWRVFHQPWALFLWLCALLLTFQATVFRHPALRRRLVAVMTTTMISIAVIGIAYFEREWLLNTLNDLLHLFLSNIPDIRTLSLSNPVTYTLINALILGIFWADTLRRWVRRASGLPPNPRSGNDKPSLEDLISGDLIAAAVLTIILAVLFSQPVVYLLAGLAQSKEPVTACTVALPGACLNSSTPDTRVTLTFIDTLLSLGTLVLGLIILALSAVLSGLGAVGGVDETMLEPSPGRGETGRSAESVGEQVSLTVVNTLRSAIDRRFRIAIAGIFLSLRNVVWPALVFLSAASLAFASRFILLYLHLHNDNTFWVTLNYLFPAMGWIVVSVGAAVLALGIYEISWEVMSNSLRFLSIVGFIVLLTFWLFSLAMWSINEFLLQTFITDRSPFALLGVSTFLSAFVLALYAVLAFIPSWRTRRSRGAPQATPRG
jgi:hypothetical protein